MENLKQYMPIMLVSFVTALFAYLLMFLIGGMASLYFAYDFDIGAWLELDGIHYTVGRSSALWTYDAEVSIILARPLMSLVAGLLALMLLLIVRRMRLFFFLLLLWLEIFAFNVAFGLLVDDAIARTGMFFVAERMLLGMPAMVVTVGVALFVMYRLGMVDSILMTRLLPGTCKSPSKARALMVMLVIVVPWLATSLIMILFTYPGSIAVEHLKILSAAVIIFPFFTYKRKKRPASKEMLSAVRPYEWLLTVLIAVASLMLFYAMSGYIALAPIQ